MKKEMLINTVEGQECRIAIVEKGRLEELYIERVSSASRVGNIYKARVTNVEPAIQAAFVDFGMTKNGFLHISDVHPLYFPKSKVTSESVGRKHRHRDRPPIQECLRRGQEVIVQMTKDGIGTKGPTMTTYLSIPGRFLVMMPGMSRLGVSRKIEDEEARNKARELLADLSLPPDMGFIVRTAGMDRSKRDLQRDLNYLLRLWKSVKQRIKQSKAPSEIYQESDLVTRTIRDVYNSDIERIICDSRSVAIKVKEFLDVAMPRSKHVIELYVGQEGLFQDYWLEDEIEKIYSRRVELPSGGSLVIDQAEALVAIDVNSGRFRNHTDAEATALKINQEAAVEIARQLRLRDLGGVIIIDFIDMREERNHRAVEKALRDAIKGDRAKTKIAKISPFGIIEMTRQRVRPSLKHSMYRICSNCHGSGLIKSEESLSLQVMRNLQRLCVNPNIAVIRLAVSTKVAHHLSNFQRRQLGQMEAASGKQIFVEAHDELLGDEVKVTCTNNRGAEVAWQQPAPAVKGEKKLATISIQDLHLPPTKQAETEEEELPETVQAGRGRTPGPERQHRGGSRPASQAGAAENRPSRRSQAGSCIHRKRRSTGCSRRRRQAAKKASRPARAEEESRQRPHAAGTGRLVKSANRRPGPASATWATARSTADDTTTNRSPKRQAGDWPSSAADCR